MPDTDPADPIAPEPTATVTVTAPAGSAVDVTVTPAHTQKVTLELVEFFPSHEPRSTDAHYGMFDRARRKLKAAGKLVCWVCGRDEQAAGAPIELHHNVIEYALSNGVDVMKFAHLFPEFNVDNEEEFFAFIESEGNLLPLCVLHHRGVQGIHSLPFPCWRAQSVWKDGLPVPGTVITGKDTESK